MALFNILVDIAARTASFDSGIKQVNEKLNDFGENVKRIFEVAAEGALAEFVKKTIELGDALNSDAQKAGVAAEAFTQLAYAVKLNGGSADSLAASFVKMNVALSNASTGGKAQLEALTALGLTYKDLKDLAPEEQFEILADRINKLGSASDKTRAEVALFGKSGADLAGLFSKGAAGIVEMRDEAERLGQSFSSEQLKIFEEAKQSIDRLEASFSALALTLVGSVAPALTKILDSISAVITQDPTAKMKSAIDFLERQADEGDGYFSTGGNLGSFGLHTGGYALDLANRLKGQLSIQNLAISPNSLKLNSTGLLDGISPGFLPDPNDALQPFHTTLGKQQIGGGAVNPAVQGYLNDTAALQEAGGKASDEFNKTQAELKGALDDGALSLEDFNDRMDAARKKFNDAINIDPVLVNVKHIQQGLTQAQQAVANFTDDITNALKTTVNESGNFGENLLKNILKALTNRAIFNAIDEIGAYLYQALKVSGDVNGGGGAAAAFSQVLLGTFGGGKAAGGPLEMGKWYTAGEHGPEPVWGGGPGAFATGYGAGGASVTINNNVDARGASVDLIQSLPAILKKNNDQLESKIVTGLQRGRYAVG